MDENSEAQVIQTIEAMTLAFQRSDVEAVMASYEPQATIVFEPGQPVTDRTRQRAWFEQAFAMKPRFTYGQHEVVQAGPLAIHFAPWTMRATAPDGQAVEQRGLSVAVLRRQPDGSWRMVMDVPHASHLLNADAPQQALR